MQQEVEQFIKRHHLIQAKSVIVVGVSGGPDSMALLHFLYRHQKQWEIQVVACCVDHMLRGPESLADLEYVRSFCEEYQIDFVGKQVDVPAYKLKSGLSTQVACRKWRFEIFAEVMEKYRASTLALAHHGDDQIETMLMRQVHGSYGLSRSGIPVKRKFASGHIIRPFLSLTKDQIEAYCREVGINPRRDPSNESDNYVRNRFRHQILPFLKEENPMVHQRFQLESEYLREDYLFLEQLARQHWDQVVLEKSSNRLTLRIDALVKCPVPLQRRLIHLILNYLYSKENNVYQSVHIEDILRLMKGSRPSSQLHLPKGLLFTRSYNRCEFSFPKACNQESAPYYQPLEIPGEVKTPFGLIRGEITDMSPAHYRGNNIFICDYSVLHESLLVRNRKKGDRISLKGINGSKKVKDILIDKKIERKLRDVWPVVVTSSDDILWLPGLAKSSMGNITKNTSIFLVLSFVR